MKLHLHRAKVHGGLFQALTRDKAGKTLSKQVSLHQDGQEIFFKRSDWKYVKQVSIDFGSHDKDVQEIRSEIQSKGVAISEITYFPHKIFVFDFEFDPMKVRVYSLDEDLARFKDRHKDIRLSPLGEFLGYDDAKFIDTIEHRFYFDLQEIGIDLHQLLDQGFFVAKVSEVDELEHKRRFIQRRLREDIPKEVEHLGIHVEDISIHSIRPRKDDDGKPEEKPSEPPSVNIENNPVINVGAPEGSVSKTKKGIGAAMISILLLVAALSSILTYFEFDIAAMRSAGALLLESAGQLLLQE